MKPRKRSTELQRLKRAVRALSGFDDSAFLDVQPQAMIRFVLDLGWEKSGEVRFDGRLTFIQYINRSVHPNPPRFFVSVPVCRLDQRYALSVRSFLLAISSYQDVVPAEALAELLR